MSPESITKKQYSTKSDVWSFAVTIVEIWTQEKPYPQFAVLEVVSEKEKINKTKKCIQYIIQNRFFYFFSKKKGYFCCKRNIETNNFKRRRSIFE